MGELAKAMLIELNQTFTDKKAGGRQVEVQFNPDSLKVTYANQLEQAKGGDQSSGNPGRQFVGSGTTKLALQLWFDVTAMQKDPVDDVRRLTEKVIYFMTAQTSEVDRKKKAPPGVRFSWGSFQFDGIVEGLEQTLDFFSPDGKPLRANISMTFSQQKILTTKFGDDGRVPAEPGRKPLKSANSGDSVQKIAAKNGKGDWQSIAAANGVEDPLRLPPGQLLDLDVGVSGGIGISGGVGISAGTAAGIAGATAGIVVSASAPRLNASLGAGVSGAFGTN